MLTGKAFSKALCGHFIVDSALPVLLTRTHLEQLGTEELNALKETYAVTASSRAEEVEQPVDECLDLLKARLVALKEALVQKSRTAKLWLQFMHHITLVKDFIHAERTSNWQLHLSTV